MKIHKNYYSPFQFAGCFTGCFTGCLFGCLAFCVIFLLIVMCSCQSSPSHILKKAIEMENVSTDSTFFYLQQIENPGKLPAKERGDYYLLSYKAALRKTGKPNDALLQTAIDHFKTNKQRDKHLKARIAQSISYFYKNQPDSTLQLSEKLLKEDQLNDTLKSQLYGIRRTAYMNKRDYQQALMMADSSRQLARSMKDTLIYFSASQMYLQVVEKMQQQDTYTQEYQQLIDELSNSSEYRFLTNYALENLLNNSLARKDYGEALAYLRQLPDQRHNRYEAPYYLYLRGKAHATLNEIDSAKYYFNQAANSSSEYIAMEANAQLFKLINEKEYPEQAFYIKKKEKMIRENILGSINTDIQQKKFNEIKLQNEIYKLNLQQQQKELWMLGIIIALLSIGLIAFFFYHREKKKRLERENQLLYKEAELSGWREKEIRLRKKEAELREALFRRIAFFHKLPSLHSTDHQDESAGNHKIVVSAAEWAEVTSVVNDAFDNFVIRLQKAYPLLGDKEIGFCCLVKINVNIQDLSDIYCVSKAAITKRKYRIKTDKLGITDENVSLDSFLKDF